MFVKIYGLICFCKSLHVEDDNEKASFVLTNLVDTPPLESNRTGGALVCSHIKNGGFCQIALAMTDGWKGDHEWIDLSSRH